MPAAAVIPAPIAYIKVVAVKKLVVEARGGLRPGLPGWCVLAGPPFLPVVLPLALNWVGGELWIVYFEKIRVFKAGLHCALNTAAWDNGIGSGTLFRWFSRAGQWLIESVGDIHI